MRRTFYNHFFVLYNTLLFQLYKSGNWDHVYIAEINEVCCNNMGAFPLKLSEYNAANKAWLPFFLTYTYTHKAQGIVNVLTWLHKIQSAH